MRAIVNCFPPRTPQGRAGVTDSPAPAGQHHRLCAVPRRRSSPSGIRLGIPGSDGQGIGLAIVLIPSLNPACVRNKAAAAPW